MGNRNVTFAPRSLLSRPFLAASQQRNGPFLRRMRSSKTSSLVQHRKVIIERHVVRYTVSRAQTVAAAWMALVQGPACAAADGRFVGPAEEIDVDATQHGDAVPVLLFRFLHGLDRILEGVKSVDLDVVQEIAHVRGHP